MLYHNSKHFPGQQDNPDADGVLRLFADSIKAYVDNQKNDTALKLDIELARISIGLRQSSQLRLWVIISEHVRTTGYNYINRVDLMSLLERYGVKYTRRNLNRWLAAGQGVYWRLTTFGRVYLISYERLAVNLTKLAYTHALYDLVNTNIPGQSKAMYVTVTSINLSQFEAQCLAAWYASRNNPTISRYVLQRLWNCNEGRLRRLERLAGVTIISNEVETTDPSQVPLQANGNLRTDVYRTKEHGQTVYHFRLPNTYHTPIIRQHHRRGQHRRVAAVIHAYLDSCELTGICGHGLNSPGELSRIGRRYCATDQLAKRNRRAHPERVLFVPDKPGEGDRIVWGIYTT